MPRRATPFLPDQYYHLYNRGNNRQTVFFERENYLFFLRGIKKYLCEYMDILVYCLMPTHYHILVRVRPQTSEVFKTSEVWGGSPGCAVRMCQVQTFLDFRSLGDFGSLASSPGRLEGLQKAAGLMQVCVAGLRGEGGRGLA